ncbi:MAG TPA: hypothetical protein VH704_01510 [Casimicrobiaceae bacterium]|nr:hypothetical protein [Casimicrobiaceae bacterium]
MTDTNARDADAIRYAVLRKLASAIRHSLMGDLQTIQFSAELAARMIDSGAGGPKLDECIKMLPDQTRAAVNSCRAMIEWLRPDDKAATTVDETLRQCLKVAGDDWSLRGIEASTDIRSGGVLVSKPALREMVVTSLLALADTHPGPIDIAIAAEAKGAEVVISLSAKQAGRKTQFPPITLYRALTYEDVMTIGTAIRVPCDCTDGTITLRLPAVAAPAQERAQER